MLFVCGLDLLMGVGGYLVGAFRWLVNWLFNLVDPSFAGWMGDVVADLILFCFICCVLGFLFVLLICHFGCFRFDIRLIGFDCELGFIRLLYLILLWILLLGLFLFVHVVDLLLVGFGLFVLVGVHLLFCFWFADG